MFSPLRAKYLKNGSSPLINIVDIESPEVPTCIAVNENLN
jgi:hypothetical protein